jgi:hypothetical protein
MDTIPVDVLRSFLVNKFFYKREYIEYKPDLAVCRDDSNHFDAMITQMQKNGLRLDFGLGPQKVRPASEHSHDCDFLVIRSLSELSQVNDWYYRYTNQKCRCVKLKPQRQPSLLYALLKDEMDKLLALSPDQGAVQLFDLHYEHSLKPIHVSYPTTIAAWQKDKLHVSEKPVWRTKHPLSYCAFILETCGPLVTLSEDQQSDVRALIVFPKESLPKYI